MKMTLLPPLWNMEVGEDILVTYGLQSQELPGGILLYLKWLTENFAAMQEYIDMELKFWEDALVVCDADIGLWYKTEAVHPIVEGDDPALAEPEALAEPFGKDVGLHVLGRHHPLFSGGEVCHDRDRPT